MMTGRDNIGTTGFPYQTHHVWKTSPLYSKGIKPLWVEIIGGAARAREKRWMKSVAVMRRKRLMFDGVVVALGGPAWAKEKNRDQIFMPFYTPEAEIETQIPTRTKRTE
jgi:hypothetical protein